MSDAQYWSDLTGLRFTMGGQIMASPNNNVTRTTFNANYLASQITEVTYESQYNGPDTLTLTLIDPDWIIQDSGLCDLDDDGFHAMVDINFPVGTDVWWRLNDVQGASSDLTTAGLQMVFQHRLVSYLQEDWGPLKVAPGTTTQAQFLKQLCDRIPHALDNASPAVLGPGSLASQSIQFVCPQLNVVQPIAPSSATTSRKSDSDNTSAKTNKGGGIGYGTKLTVKGNTMTRAQVDVANALLREATGLTSVTIVLVALMVAAIFENSVSLGMESNGRIGPLSPFPTAHYTDDMAGAATQAHDFVEGGHAFSSAATYAASNLSVDAVTLAEYAEGAEGQYQQQSFSVAAATAEAKAIVSEFGGGTGGSSGTDASTRKPKSNVGQLERGTSQNPDEDSWTCMQRLASAENWELFTSAHPADGVWGNYLYYMTGPYNDQQMPAAYLTRSDVNKGTWDLKQSTSKQPAFVRNALPSQPNYQVDNSAFIYKTTKRRRGRVQRQVRQVKSQTPTNVTCSVVCEPMTFNAGQVVVFQNSGPINGRWIVSDNTRNLIGDLFSQLTLVPPTSPNKQADATSTTTKKNGGGPTLSGNVLTDVVAAAKQAVSERGKYGYQETRPMPSSLFGPVPRIMDCSAFVTLCYKWAKGPDPNGLGYNGEGYTGDIQAHCTRISEGDLQPGDLAMWEGPGHVVIYIGGGQVISQGGPTGYPSGPVQEAKTSEDAYHSGFLGYYRVPSV